MRVSFPFFPGPRLKGGGFCEDLVMCNQREEKAYLLKCNSALLYMIVLSCGALSDGVLLRQRPRTPSKEYVTRSTSAPHHVDLLNERSPFHEAREEDKRREKIKAEL